VTGIASNSTYKGFTVATDQPKDEGGDGTGDIWVANDGADSPIKAYNTSEQLVNYVPGSDLPSGIECRGLCFDTDGFLWVSNDDTDEIYKLDITTGIEEGSGSSAGQPGLTVSSNPFSASVTISVVDSPESFDLTIFDLSGRTIIKTELAASASYTWSGRTASGEIVPSGTYLVRAADPSGQIIKMLVTRL